MIESLGTVLSSALTAAYTVGLLVLGLYGLKALAVTVAWLRVRGRKEPPPSQSSHASVTVQLPIFNERHVASRVIDAACALSWPADALEIQVLDDSTDDTCELVDASVRSWRARGVAVEVIRREDRSGYKAGALAHGLRVARGELIAVFDADFLPGHDFLERVAPYLTPDVAVVQTRWGHLNADASGLTRAQALALDGHFIVEQTARSNLGLFLNFNGTGGMWRREAIDQAGGWQHDTLSEDVDLSYRAQLAGWRVLFLPDVVVPGELPATVLAFKRQQRRWATGTTQVLLKLGPSVWHSDRSLAVRLHALFSLAAHFMHPVSLGLFLLSPLMIVVHPTLHAVLGLLTFVALCPPLMYALAAAQLHRDWPRRLAVYPLLVALTVGMSLNGSVAVARALTGRGGGFERTPKAGTGSATDGTPYALRADRWTLLEAALAVCAWVWLAVAIQQGVLGLVVFLGLFAVGYTLVFALSVAGQMWRRFSPAPSRVPAGEP